MKTYIDTGRGGGKTTAIMEQFLLTPCILLVLSDAERQRLIDVYNVPEERQGDIVSWNNPSLREKLRGKDHPVYIDNVDYFLEMFLQRKVDWVTFTTDLSEP